MIGKTTFLFGIACFLGAKPVKLPGSNSHGNVNSFNFIFFCSIRWAILSAKGSHGKNTSYWSMFDGYVSWYRSVHPGRLTWNIIMEVLKIIFLSKWVICRFHVNLPGCSAGVEVGIWIVHGENRSDRLSSGKLQNIKWYCGWSRNPAITSWGW